MAHVKRGRLAIVCLDGLSQKELGKLASALPKKSKYFHESTGSLLDGGLLTTSEAIWAELLTGSPWYENSCIGHAAPHGSLNSTKLVSELDLKSPVRLFSVVPEGQRQMSVNLPLLLPQEPDRIWLSDGSMPLPQLISQQLLAGNDLFKSYSPRAYVGLCEMYSGTRLKSLRKLMTNEQNRLECALQAGRDFDFGVAVIRLSFFDQVAHLLGPGCMLDDDLVYSLEIRQFLQYLEEWLVQFSEEVSEIILLSAFSHEYCHYRLSLNELLNEGGFLTFKQPDTMSRRREVVLALAELDSETESPAQTELTGKQKLFHQAYFDCSSTVAASPVYGCIYINAGNRFVDGIVSPDEVVDLRNEVQQYLSDALRRRSIFDFSIWSANQEPGHSLNDIFPQRPDLLVRIAGADLHNNPEPTFRFYDRPPSVHNPRGFILSGSRRFPPMVNTHEFYKLL